MVDQRRGQVYLNYRRKIVVENELISVNDEKMVSVFEESGS
jgi:hypothetical protein